MPDHGIRRLDGGGVEVHLSSRELELLRGLPDQLRPVLTGEHDVAGAHERLFPPAYTDIEREAEYRELVGTALAEERLAALETFAKTLAGGRSLGRGWTARLDGDQAQAWLSALNDARLTLAAVIGVTSESEWEQGPEPDDPVSVALWYLGRLQEELLAALMGHLKAGGDAPA